ncbi:MAG: ABC transporter ATP-binding protein [Syntrophorhabdaceae bacterium]|nr:ABC transporter ATP-binding protein [Syntrophorhabdaceae bacterium]MDD5244403.1 ABC transporter ATP-binding protein [Syntrophorhabdaceae bacterium]
MNIVTAKGLTKDFNGLRAVDSVDFEIRKGECFGFLGPNGAGKTTVMRVLYCFIEPTSGDVKVFDLNVKDEPSLIKSRLGVMPQEENLDLELSVIENLIVYARYFDIPKNTSLAIATELLSYVELSGKANVSIKNLSGGMKRSLLLARALLNGPELLILDEPTTGLDPHTRQVVWKKLNDLKARDTTLILTTHYMEEADRLCDRAAIMDQGKIITIDSPERLKEKHGGNLEEVYLKLTGRLLED